MNYSEFRSPLRIQRNPVLAAQHEGEAQGLSRGWSIAAWALQAALGFMIAGGGLLKLSGDTAMVEMFDDIGIGQWFRFVVGSLEIAGGVGLLIPRLRLLSALGLIALLTCATLTNLIVLETSPVASTLFAFMALAIAVLRRHELRWFRGAR